jgi:transposase
MAIEGSTTREVFEAYVEHLLAPTLTTGQVVVMNNLCAHKGERGRELIEDRDCELLHSPPYSPDMNPVEEAFSKIKRFLRQIRARTRGAWVEATGKALECGQCQGYAWFFAHCGYRMRAELAGLSETLI